jgi:hypothetical protein
VSAYDDRARHALQARGDSVHHAQDARLRLGGADREHREILTVGETDENPFLCRLNLQLRALDRLGLSPEPFL